MDELKRKKIIFRFRIYQNSFTVEICKAEAYRTQREMVISVCKFWFQILFVPCTFLLYRRNSEEGGWYI